MSAANFGASAACVGSPRLGDLARGAGGVAGDDRLPAVLADDLAALAERVDVAVHRLDVLERRALDRHQLELDRQEVLADDVQAGVRQQMMNVGDAARDRIFDRDHAEFGLSGRDRGKQSSKVGAGSGWTSG